MYETPQEAEDAFYDALDEADLEKLLTVWSSGEDIGCLLPMQPMIRGRKGIETLFGHVFSRQRGVSLAITHLDWIESGDTAVHLVEETLQNAPPGAPPPVPFYGTNIYRRETDGWRLIIHLNSPTPPPEMVMPDPS